MIFDYKLFRVIGLKNIKVSKRIFFLFYKKLKKLATILS